MRVVNVNNWCIPLCFNPLASDLVLMQSVAVIFDYVSTELRKFLSTVLLGLSVALWSAVDSGSLARALE